MVKPGKQNAQKVSRRSADMSTRPDGRVYVPPPKEACEEYHYPVPIDDAGLVQFVWAQRAYRGHVVDFSIEIQVRDHAMADWQTAYRIDSSHGTIHEHRYSPTGEQRVEIEEIPLKDSWKFVDTWFTKAMEMCDDAWATHVERWRR